MKFRESLKFDIKKNFKYIYFILIFLFSILLMSCDSAFRYIFMPQERITFTLIPDSILIISRKDSAYYVSKDGNSAVFDKKDYKIEVKYLSDYQLNNFEFPEESKNGELSANPYTNANWIDPALGYSPNRFSVFKVTIYNYAAAKINYDPENSGLVSNRGDEFTPYGITQKTSRYKSLEEYFKRRQGSSGVSDEIYEGRMGIVRNTLFTLGKPLFRGDTRQGLLLFDPLNEEVGKIKITIKKFILGYDENNEPNEFCDLVFYFARVPFVPPTQKQIAGGGYLDSSSIFVLPNVDAAKIAEEINIAQLQYPATNITGTQEYWNPAPEATTDLIKHISTNTNLKVTTSHINLETSSLKGTKIAFMFGQTCSPILTDTMIGSLTELITSGGFLFVDNADATIASSFGQSMDKVFLSVVNRIGPDAKYQRISLNNPIYSIWKKFKNIPPGQEAFAESNIREQTVEYLEGISIKGKIVAVLSHKGYSKAWGLWKKGGRDIDNTQQLNLGTNLIMYSIISNMKTKK